MHEHTTTTPARSPRRGRTGRRRHERPETPHLVRRIGDDAAARSVTYESEQAVPHMEGGGSSGRGPGGDDGDGDSRRPERGGDDARRLLIALGILAVGAGVMSARLLTKAARRTG